MIILDTNVISAFMKPSVDESVIAWLDHQPASSIWTTSITVLEIEYGLRRLPTGNRRALLQTRLAEMLNEDLGGRVLPLDTPAALAAGALSVELEAKGRSVEIQDALIAGIARIRQAVLATRNVRHFEFACTVVNPWESA